MNPLTAEDVIDALELEPHPLEGGFFRETYHHKQQVQGQERSISSAIYYLLTPTSYSAMHRLPTDEIFHFYIGDPVMQLHLKADGSSEVKTIGANLLAGHRPQVLVPGGTWQGAFLAPGGKFALLGTTMAPGFAYPEFELGKRDDLVAKFPVYAELIRRLTAER